MTEPRPKPDGRSSLARRHRVLAGNFAADLGGMTNLSHAERALVDQAAMVTLRAEQLRGAMLSGEIIDDDVLVRLNNSAVRILNALTAQRKRKGDAPPSLEDYLETPDAS